MIKKIREYWRRGWMITLGSTRKVYHDFLVRLDENKPFTFSRWGDGEWEAVLKLKGQEEANCDGHRYFDSMCEELRNILVKRVPYLLGMQRLAYHKVMGRRIDQFLRANQIRANDLDWVDADVFHDASMKGEIIPFFDALKKKKVLLVGPEYLQKFTLFPFQMVKIPPVNCWLERERILADIQTHVAAHPTDVVLFCAGMTTNWMVDQLHGEFKGFIIDIGSLLDPFAGKSTRNYHKVLSEKYAFLAK